MEKAACEQTSRLVSSDLKFEPLLLPVFGCTPPSQLLIMAIIHVISSPKSGECQIILLSLLPSSC